MPPDNIEKSFTEILDGLKETQEIETLRKLLKTVMVNRRAMEILKALEEGDAGQATQIAMEAKKTGIHPDELKAACRTLRK